MSDFKLGVLGLGYLGGRLFEDYTWAPGSFAAGHGEQPSGFDGDWVAFDWGQPESFAQIPESADGLVITIPPLLEKPQDEAARVTAWGAWMNEHRPSIKRLVYISSTGVFPNRPGTYSEDTQPLPESEKGKLRWTTEQALAPFFDLRVVRPAAIYGPSRGIPQRLRQNMPIPTDSGKIQRVHVADLAAICYLALTQKKMPKVIHAIDREPATSLEVAQWLLSQTAWAGVEMTTEGGYLARRGYSSVPGRLIETRRLDDLGFIHQFPDYRAALAQEKP